jgi:hypothetical protein
MKQNFREPGSGVGVNSGLDAPGSTFIGNFVKRQYVLFSD